MALYNQLAFIMLVLEILTFLTLIIPLPFTWRRALFKAIATSPIIAKLQYAMKITFIGIGVLFVDAVRAMLKVQADGQLARESGVPRDTRMESDFRSPVLAERNFYLHGFTLFLSLILSRTYSLVLDLIKAQEDLALLQSQQTSKQTAGNDPELVKKYELLQADYDNLATKLANATGSVTNKKKD